MLLLCFQLLDNRLDVLDSLLVRGWFETLAVVSVVMAVVARVEEVVTDAGLVPGHRLDVVRFDEPFVRVFVVRGQVATDCFKVKIERQVEFIRRGDLVVDQLAFRVKTTELFERVEVLAIRTHIKLFRLFFLPFSHKFLIIFFVLLFLLLHHH